MHRSKVAEILTITSFSFSSSGILAHGHHLSHLTTRAVGRETRTWQRFQHSIKRGIAHPVVCPGRSPRSTSGIAPRVFAYVANAHRASPPGGLTDGFREVSQMHRRA